MSDISSINPLNDGFSEHYTPTTEEVRTAFGNYFREEACCDEHALLDYHGAFDRWLEQVKAEAWEEGYAAGDADATGERLNRDNPYIPEIGKETE